MGSIFTAGFGILLLLLLTNWILRSLNKMIKDKEMKEILDEMKKEKEEERGDEVFPVGLLPQPHAHHHGGAAFVRGNCKVARS